jgi:tRNA (cmo5U34)-methyltransferase
MVRKVVEEKLPDFTFAHREEGFDKHIEDSIRGYGNLHDDVVNISRYFVEDNTNVVDIGASTGKTIEAMIRQNISFAPDAFYCGVENATGFQKELSERSKRVNEEFVTNFDYSNMDIRDFRFDNCSYVTSLFTLQFMPMKDRLAVVRDIYNGLNPGGAFVFAEKTVAENARIQEMMTFTYYDYKRKSFTEKDIMDKEITLRNMLKPNTFGELKGMLFEAGFETVQPFWQNFLFVGAIAIK